MNFHFEFPGKYFEIFLEFPFKDFNLNVCEVFKYFMLSLALPRVAN